MERSLFLPFALFTITFPHVSKDYPVSNYKEYRTSRNPYWQIIRDFQAKMERPTVLADEFTEQNKGKWREFFGMAPDAFLNLELGAYHGETSNHLARTNPKTAHLAIEWKYKQCFKAGKKAKDQALSNITFLRANIARLPWMFAKNEVDRIWVLFPDPWSRKAQQKWRVLNPGFFRMLGSMLAQGKEVMIKTDHADYADYIRESIAEAKCFDNMETTQAQEIFALIPPTPFERIFLRQGLPIYTFALVRNGESVVAPEEVQHVITLQ